MVIFISTSTGATWRFGSRTTRMPMTFPMSTPFQSDGRSYSQTTCVIHIGSNLDFLGKQAGGAGHQEDQDRQCNAGDDDGQANPQL